MKEQVKEFLMEIHVIHNGVCGNFLDLRPSTKVVSESPRWSSSRKFEGVMPIWNLVECILKYPSQFHTIDDVEGLDILECEDQKKIKKYFEGLCEGSAPTNAYKLVEGIDEYSIEKSKSSHANCKRCNQKIAKGEIHISTMDDPENPWFHGTVAVWHHTKCFLEIGWWTSPIENMSGWESLSPEDKHVVQSL
jgi:hypothetical protein